MKRFLLLILPVIWLTSCQSAKRVETWHYAHEHRKPIDTSGLEKAYGIPHAKFVKFTENLIRDKKGRIRGAKIAGLRKMLTDEQIKTLIHELIVRNIDPDVLQKTPPQIFTGYKPIPRGCKAHKGYVCVVYGKLFKKIDR